jgi:hypothetical protein
MPPVSSGGPLGGIGPVDTGGSADTITEATWTKPSPPDVRTEWFMEDSNSPLETKFAVTEQPSGDEYLLNRTTVMVPGNLLRANGGRSSSGQITWDLEFHPDIYHRMTETNPYEVDSVNPPGGYDIKDPATPENTQFKVVEKASGKIYFLKKKMINAEYINTTANSRHVKPTLFWEVFRPYDSPAVPDDSAKFQSIFHIPKL